MKIAERRAAFQHLVAHYHNSFSGLVEGRHEHNRLFVRRMLRESKDAGLNAAALRLDPRLTSTESGAVAYSIAKAMSEEKALAPYFVDIEVVAEGKLVVYMEHQTNGVKLERVLSQIGECGCLAKPNDHLSDTVVSDLWVMQVEPAAKVTEAIVAEMRKALAESSVFDADRDDNSGGKDEQREMPHHDGKKGKDGKAKDDKDCDDDEEDDDKDAKDELARESAAPATDAAHLKLDERVFSDEALARCGVTHEMARTLAARVFGESALPAILEAKLAAGPVTNGGEAAASARLLRTLGARGAIAGGARAKLPEAVAKAVADALKAVRESLGAKDGQAALCLSVEAYEGAVDELALAVDGALAEAGDIAALFVERVVDHGLEPMDEGRRSKLVARVSEAMAKDQKAAIGGALRALARGLAVEGLVAATQAEADAMAAWGAHVAESTKAPPEPVDPLASTIDALLAVPA